MGINTLAAITRLWPVSDTMGRQIWCAVQIGKCAKLELIGDMHTDNGEYAGTLIREAFMETMLSTLYKTDAGGTALKNEEYILTA